MMTNLTKVLISPVGLYKNRVIKGIKWIRPDWVFLLVAKDEKSKKGRQDGKSWGDWTMEHANEIQQKISFFYEDHIRMVSCDFEDYKSFFNQLNDLVANTIPNLVTSPEIWLDLTSVPEIPEVAILALATIHENISLFYTRARAPLRPSEYPEKVITDDGGDHLILPTVRSVRLADLKKSKHGDILRATAKAGGSVDGLNTLLDMIGLAKEKKHYMRLGRILDELERYGMIVMEKVNREKRIKLTLWGEMIASCLNQV